jgi:hypothetical protein
MSAIVRWFLNPKFHMGITPICWFKGPLFRAFHVRPARSAAPNLLQLYPERIAARSLYATPQR